MTEDCTRYYCFHEIADRTVSQARSCQWINPDGTCCSGEEGCSVLFEANAKVSPPVELLEGKSVNSLKDISALIAKPHQNG